MTDSNPWLFLTRPISGGLLVAAAALGRARDLAAPAPPEAHGRRGRRRFLAGVRLTACWQGWSSSQSANAFRVGVAGVAHLRLQDKMTPRWPPCRMRDRNPFCLRYRCAIRASMAMAAPRPMAAASSARAMLSNVAALSARDRPTSPAWSSQRLPIIRTAASHAGEACGEIQRALPQKTGAHNGNCVMGTSGRANNAAFAA